jgi:hypothetical protein
MSGHFITWGPVIARVKDTIAEITIPQCSHKYLQQVANRPVDDSVQGAQGIVSLYSLPVPYSRTFRILSLPSCTNKEKGYNALSKQNKINVYMLYVFWLLLFA